MYVLKPLVILAGAAAAVALPHSAGKHGGVCRELRIPVTVSVPRFHVAVNVENDWDAAALTLNLTRRDFGNVTDPLPIVGGLSAPVKSTYSIGATLCENGGPMLILTHGIIESKLYWDPTFPGGNKYSLIDAALEAGYSVLSYDRIGVGSSSKVDALSDAQFQVETAVLNALVEYAKTTVKACKVALVGHSYGAYLSAASASLVDVDAVALTGFSGTFDYFGPFLAGAGLSVAKLKDPLRWGHLDSAYLTCSNLYAESYVYFAQPYFERRVAEWTYRVESEPFAVGELPSLLATTIDYKDITAPVLIQLGEFDVSACGGYCIGVLNQTYSMFTQAKVLKTVDNLPAGHNLNLHNVAPQAFAMLFEFLKAQGV